MGLADYGCDSASVGIIATVALVEEGTVYIPLVILDSITSAFADMIVKETQNGEDEGPEAAAFIAGAISVMEVLKTISDGLLGYFAEDIVPDHVPDGLDELE